jgi:hypothetical protein
MLENCKEVIDAWVSYFLVEQLTKINKLNVGLGYWGCSMYEQETVRIRQLRAEFEAQWRMGHRQEASMWSFHQSSKRCKTWQVGFVKQFEAISHKGACLKTKMHSIYQFCHPLLLQGTQE